MILGSPANFPSLSGVLISLPVSSSVWTTTGNTVFKQSISIIGSVPTHKVMKEENGKTWKERASEGMQKTG
jgi:hypothetical protein